MMHVKNMGDFRGPLIFSGGIMVRVRYIKGTISDYARFLIISFTLMIIY